MSHDTMAQAREILMLRTRLLKKMYHFMWNEILYPPPHVESASLLSQNAAPSWKTTQEEMNVRWGTVTQRPRDGTFDEMP